MKKLYQLLLAILTGAAAMAALNGCQSPGASTQPSLLTVGINLAAIDAAKIGITQGLSPKVESAYASGKMPFNVYMLARGEEATALASLDGLRAKVLNGGTVTQADLNTAESNFIAPLEDLVAQYVGQLPATQPAR
jgi:hypothetical protein